MVYQESQGIETWINKRLSLKLEFKWEISFQSDKGELWMNAKIPRRAMED